ncbi:highly acidic protein [Campylobacter sp. MIT 12-5580]|uniref:highly acidic protein n=1 Tax=Campylobacter sp. MIT 12-5580 TaxID=2040651 RepID=UPI0010F66EF5|nr:highly acidic protein [Campylobacter sp. MIT 12-5580]TKX28480.1 highly acidic protein [Campylobacter sp. MIT 12-5580]
MREFEDDEFEDLDDQDILSYEDEDDYLRSEHSRNYNYDEDDYNFDDEDYDDSYEME